MKLSEGWLIMDIYDKIMFIFENKNFLYHTSETKTLNMHHIFVDTEHGETVFYVYNDNEEEILKFGKYKWYSGDISFPKKISGISEKQYNENMLQYNVILTNAELELLELSFKIKCLAKKGIYISPNSPLEVVESIKNVYEYVKYKRGIDGHL